MVRSGPSTAGLRAEIRAMRYGIISDIHGNLEALEAALAALEALDVDTYVCLGDLVGYGADPNECTARIERLTGLVVVGNHDHAAVGLTDISFFNPYARQAVLWTAAQLTGDHAAYLRGLPFVLRGGRDKGIPDKDVLFVHATPDRPEHWRYLLTESEARRQLGGLETSLCFIGHTHRAAIFLRSPQGELRVTDDAVIVGRQNRAIVNVGSVGQPRDLDPRAAFAIWDSASGRTAIHRAAYDIQKAQHKIREAGLPEVLAQRLAYGE